MQAIQVTKRDETLILFLDSKLASSLKETQQAAGY